MGIQLKTGTITEVKTETKTSKKLIKRLKRSPLAILKKKQDKIMKAVARQQAYDAETKRTLGQAVIISNWCDNGVTAPKCGHCPNCLELKNGMQINQVVVVPELNPSAAVTVNLPKTEVDNAIADIEALQDRALSTVAIPRTIPA